MSAGRAAWLVAYDVASPRRLVRVHRILKGSATAAQFSVFVAWCSRHDLDALLQRVGTRIEPRQDDVRAYRLPPARWYEALGRTTLPRGIVAAVDAYRLD